MVLFNYSTRELTAKIVYYGPGLCGKTTNLQYIFENLPGAVKGKMLSLATKTDRTLFFDFLPLDLGEIRGMKTRIQLYTVPGQVFYNETRRLVLKGADGVVFVADSQKQMLEANADSYRNLEENLRVHAMRLADMPLVLQYNKRDLPNLASIEDLNAAINRHNSPFYESVATTGICVQDTLKAITKLVLLHLTKKYDQKQKASETAVASVSVAAGAGARPHLVQPASVGYPSRAGGEAGTAEVERNAKPMAAAVRSADVSPMASPITSYDETAASGDGIVELTEVVEEEATAEVSARAEPVELDDIIEEPASAAGVSEPAVEREFEIDHSVEDDFAPEAPALDRVATQGPPAPHEARGAVIPIHVTEVPRLAIGRPQEIVLPIELETPGGLRKLTLSIRVQLSEHPTGE